MNFDPTIAPVRSGLPPMLAAKADALFYARRKFGFNVQFIRETDGVRDEFSFIDAARRDAFVASLKRRGVVFAVSN